MICEGICVVKLFALKRQGHGPPKLEIRQWDSTKWISCFLRKGSGIGLLFKSAVFKHKPEVFALQASSAGRFITEQCVHRGVFIFYR